MKINLFENFFDYVRNVFPVACNELHLEKDLLPFLDVDLLMQVEENLCEPSLNEYRKGCAVLIADAQAFVKRYSTEDKELLETAFQDEAILSRFDKIEDIAVLGK